MDYLTDWDSSQTAGNIGLLECDRQASRGALTMAGITPADLDMIILATSTPMTYLAVLVKSSPSWEPPEQLPLTLQQLLFRFVDCHRCPVPQNWRYQNILLIGADISPAG